jgi:hypothetical protein
VNFYIAYLDQLNASIPFSKLATQIRGEFKRRAANNEASSRHIETMSETLTKLEAKFGNRSVATIETKELREWLLALPLAAKTRNKHRGYARQIFSLAIDYGYRPTNPLLGVKKFRERSSEENGEISIVTPENTKKLFESADSQVIPFLVLNFFCGIRRSTVERLDWSDVSIAKKHVIVPRYKGDDVLARILAKGQLFSIGIVPVNTYADPGFSGRLGITLFNASHRYLVIAPGQAIAKIEFAKLGASVSRPYSGQHGYETGIWPIPTQLYAKQELLKRQKIDPQSLEEIERSYGPIVGSLENRLRRYERRIWLQISLTVIFFGIIFIVAGKVDWTVSISLGVLANFATSLVGFGVKTLRRK